MSVFRDKDNLFCQNDTVIPPFFLLREVPEGVICAQIEEAKAQIAIVGNLAVFLIMEGVHVYYSTHVGMFGSDSSYGYSYSWQAGSHWTLVILALMWTIFWTLYFARSVRMRHYMSPDNPYTTANGLPYVERALFGKGMRG